MLTLLTPALPLLAQPQRLTLDDCRDMAVRTNKALDQARTEIEMAGYDRKIALANYFPKISATGTYQYNNRDIALISDSQSAMLRGAGDLMQAQLDGAVSAMNQQISGALTQAMTGSMTQLMTAIQSNPLLALDYMTSPMWQTVLGMLQQADPSALVQLQAPDIAGPVNAIGADIDQALHPDMHS